jgi:hypothetical protein
LEIRFIFSHQGSLFEYAHMSYIYGIFFIDNGRIGRKKSLCTSAAQPMQYVVVLIRRIEAQVHSDDKFGKMEKLEKLPKWHL